MTPSDRMSQMQAIGERLREARMRRGIDVTEVERAIKIRAKYLRAMENEDFDQLPGPTFVKTFLRTYAEYLGLDAQLLVEEYRAQHEQRAADVQPIVSTPGRRQRQGGAAGGGGGRPRSPGRTAGPGTALLVAVVMVLVIFAILGLTGGSNNSTKQAQTTATTAPKPRPAVAAPKPKPKPTTVTLRVRPVVSTYLCVDTGLGTTPLIDTDISQPMTFHGKHLRINAGISSLVMIVNGRRVQVPPSSQPIGYDFTPTSTTPIPAGPQRPCVGPTTGGTGAGGTGATGATTTGTAPGH